MCGIFGILIKFHTNKTNQCTRNNFFPDQHLTFSHQQISH